jgi:hypothetical protein
VNILASTTTAVHVIGKCPVKGCKNRRRVVIPDAPIKRTGVYTFTEAKPCTAACRAAFGPHCDCVCGGEGHGSNYDLRMGDGR